MNIPSPHPVPVLAPIPVAERQPLTLFHQLQDGDLVFIRSRTANAANIARLSNVEATDDDSPLSDKVFTHCGIVFKDGEDWKVYEAAGRGTDNHGRPIVYTLEEWQREEAKVGEVVKQPLHHVYVRRWNGMPPLDADKLRTIHNEAFRMHQTGYDKGFCWTNHRTYCSELIWKAYGAAGLVFGQLPTMGHYVAALTQSSHEAAERVKAMIEAAKHEYRDGKGYDENESAISPEDLFNSDALISVTD